MALDIREINKRVSNDAYDFVLSCEAEYNEKVQSAAKRIAAGVAESCIVLVSGPSGSGKTTTALKLTRALESFGVGTHAVSLDNYFKTVDPQTAPRTEQGEIDYESPYCLDIPLLKEQIQAMIRGDEVEIPKFIFAEQRRSSSMVPLRRRKNEVVIIEGIHALNDMITGSAGSHGLKLYISARSNYEKDRALAFKGTWVRLIRRIVRDERFRGTGINFTLGIWDSIRLGEKKYISPFKNRADIMLDSTHAYEVNMLKKHILPLFSEVPKGIARYHEIMQIPKALEEFEDVDDKLVPVDSLLREFIGGGNFQY